MLRHEEFVAEDRKDYEALVFNEAVMCMKNGTRILRRFGFFFVRSFVNPDGEQAELYRYR